MNKRLLLFLILLLTFIVVAFVLRIFNPEDTWICDDGSWVKHGNPSTEKPDVPCKMLNVN